MAPTFSPAPPRIEWIRLGRPTLVGLCVGAIAGLATITPAAGFIEPSGASLGNKSGDAGWLFFLIPKLVMQKKTIIFRGFFKFGSLMNTKCMALQFILCLLTIYFCLFVPFPWEIWERFSQSIYKNGHLLSLCIGAFLCMILTADFLEGVQGRSSSKCKIHCCESALKTNRNSDSAPRSTCQLYLSLKSLSTRRSIR